MSDKIFNELYADAQQMYEQATSYANIGKFGRYSMPKIYDNGQWIECDKDLEKWRGFSGLKIIELNCSVDVQEFNPSLQYQYERRVQVNRTPFYKRAAGGKPEVIKSDWFENFMPSLLEVTGMSDVQKALEHLDGKYVKVIDVLQQPTKQQPEPTYNTIKFVEVYTSREEAYAAYQALRGGSAETSSTKTYDEEVVKSVKLMCQSPLSDEDIVKSLGVPELTAQDVATIRGM